MRKSVDPQLLEKISDIPEAAGKGRGAEAISGLGRSFFMQALNQYWFQTGLFTRKLQPA